MNNEFIDFKFGNYWASDFNLVVVSSSDRHSTPLFGNIDSNTSTVAGKVGVYKWSTQVNEKTFQMHLAFDNLPIDYLNPLKKWLNPMEVKRLVFSDEPYKFYYASINAEPQFSFLPFLTEMNDVGNNSYQNGVYRGELDITFICIDNYGYSEYDNFENPQLNYFATDIIGDIQPDQDFYYTNIITDSMLTDDASLLITDGRVLNVENYSEYDFISEEAFENFDFDEASEADRYSFLLNNALKANAGVEEGFKPWVKASNLLNEADLYNLNLIYTASVYSALDNFTLYPIGGETSISLNGLNTPAIYLLNSGTTNANLIMSFEFLSIAQNTPLVITIDKVKILNSNNNIVNWSTMTSAFSQVTINYFENYQPYIDFIEETIPVGGSFAYTDYLIIIDSELCEMYLVHKATGAKLNLNRFNANQSFLTLSNCNFVDYAKAFPTSLLAVENTAIRKTFFNKLTATADYVLPNVNLKWKHTYL